MNKSKSKKKKKDLHRSILMMQPFQQKIFLVFRLYMDRLFSKEHNELPQRFFCHYSLTFRRHEIEYKMLAKT